jgi:hypothetical protein
VYRWRETGINPWLETVTGTEYVGSGKWMFSFWEKQPKPIGPLGEGSTEVDLVLESDKLLTFVEVKMDAEPSRGARNDPERNQLLRNLDVGHRRAREAKRAFALVYVTPDLSEPEIVLRLRTDSCTFPANADVDACAIRACLFWSSWSLVGSVLAASYSGGKLDNVERKFALDLLAYLCGKRLWNNTLEDDPLFYGDKLYRSLRKNDSPFVPYAYSKVERYQAWRTKPWQEANLREYLQGLRCQDKALLKLLADADGALQQRTIMQQLPFLRGRTSASLRNLKSHVNAGCRQLDCAQILAGRPVITALVDAKGSCSCRLYDALTGCFIRKLPNAHGSFRAAFAHVTRGGKEFQPSYQPDLVSTEKLDCLQTCFWQRSHSRN